MLGIREHTRSRLPVYLALGACIAAAAVMGRSAAMRRNPVGKKSASPKAVERWENEGGLVPPEE